MWSGGCGSLQSPSDRPPGEYASRRTRAPGSEPAVARDTLPALLAGADALLSATQPRRTETLDKVVYEAAACEVPVVASNAALTEFLGGLPLELSFSPITSEVAWKLSPG